MNFGQEMRPHIFGTLIGAYLKKSHTELVYTKIYSQEMILTRIKERETW